MRRMNNVMMPTIASRHFEDLEVIIVSLIELFILFTFAAEGQTQGTDNERSKYHDIGKPSEPIE